jgi:hypothetical protein
MHPARAAQSSRLRVALVSLLGIVAFLAGLAGTASLWLGLHAGASHAPLTQHDFDGGGYSHLSAAVACTGLFATGCACIFVCVAGGLFAARRASGIGVAIACTGLFLLAAIACAGFLAGRYLDAIHTKANSASQITTPSAR